MNKLRQQFFTLHKLYSQSHGTNADALNALRDLKRNVPFDRAMYAVWLDVLGTSGDVNELKGLAPEMRKCEIPPDPTVYGRVLQELSKLGAFRACEDVVQDMLTNRVSADTVLFDKIKEEWSNISELRGCLSVLLEVRGEVPPIGFDIVPPSSRPQIKPLTDAEISGIAKAFGKMKTARECEPWLQELRNKDNCISYYNTILDNVNVDEILWAIFKEIKQQGLTPTMYTFNILIGKLTKKGGMKTIAELLHIMQQYGLQANEVTYNILIRSRVEACDKKGCLQVLDLMLKKGAKPNIITFNQILKLARDLRDKQMYYQVKKAVIASKLEINEATHQLLTDPEDQYFWTTSPKKDYLY